MVDLLFKLAGPALALLDPERAHGLAIRALKSGLVGAVPRPADDPILATTVWTCVPQSGRAGGRVRQGCGGLRRRAGPGLRIRGGRHGDAAAQPGNSGQRLYRLAEDEAVINRFGFNSRGLAPFVANLAKRRGRGGIVGANVGKNRDTADGAADYVAGISAVGALADYLVVNISSPNTPGLRDLQARDSIADLLARVQQARRRGGTSRPPLLVKVGPDLDEADLPISPRS